MDLKSPKYSLKWTYEVQIEMKYSTRLKKEDFDSLKLFLEDYPEAKGMIIYGGTRSYQGDPIEVMNASDFFEKSMGLF